MKLSAPQVMVIAALATGWLAAPPDPAQAIPAFARKYQVSCSTCHAPFPRLKEFGEEFAANGFKMPDEAQEPARATIDTGDPLLRLNRDFPVAARIEAHGVFREEGEPESEFESPWVFKVLSGGPLAERVSYYVYFILEEGEVTGLEDAYLHFRTLFGSKVDLLVGQFQVSDPLFKRELRLERSDYEILKVRVGDASPNLTYDRGLMLLTRVPGDVDLVLGVVNGNGIPEGVFDNDGQKNVLLRLARQIGPVRLGAFGYWGKEIGSTGASNRVTYLGPDVRVTLGKRWEASLEYLERRDDDPYFLGGSPPTVETDGGFVELLFFPQGQDERWALAGLYNRIRSDDAAAELEDVSFTANYLLARNVRLQVEVGRDLDVNAARGSVGVVAAF